MTRPILLVDDDPLVRETLAELLGAEGYDVQVESNATAARERLKTEPRPELVILDMKLRGPDGDDEGLELIAESRGLIPEAPVILITGYANDVTIRTAYNAGAWDLLVKNEHFLTLLPIRVRHALFSASLELRSWSPSSAGQERLERAWREVRDESDRARKARLLEEVAALLFVTIPGFQWVGRNVRSPREEIDVVVRNESSDPFWARQGAYFLVECKNQSSRVSVQDIKVFVSKVRGRYGRSDLGFMLAPGGFASTASDEASRLQESGTLIVLLGFEEIDALITDPDRSSLLKRYVDRAVFGAKS